MEPEPAKGFIDEKTRFFRRAKMLHRSLGRGRAWHTFCSVIFATRDGGGGKS
jgi:hypothetical protein